MATPPTESMASDHFTAPPDWIAVIVLIGSMLVIAVTIIVVRAVMLSRTGTTPIRPDLESPLPIPFRRSQRDPVADAAALNALDKLAPTKSYAKLKAGDIHPDQSGPRVECVICLELFTSDSTVRCLKCHHVFHAACIDRWLLAHHRTCPLCLACYIPPEALPARPPLARVLPYPELPLRRMLTG